MIKFLLEVEAIASLYILFKLSFHCKLVNRQSKDGNDSDQTITKLI